MNQMTRRLDAEKIRQDFIKSKKLELKPQPVYPRIVRSAQDKPTN